MPEIVLYEVSDSVATITLNRPRAMNALNDELKVALRETLLQAAHDAHVRAVVLTGSGRAFCVGQDLIEHARNLETAGETEEVWGTVAEHYAPMTITLATMPKPVVAAVNGVAAGAGAAFAMACDFRILSDTGGFNMAFAAIGLSADSGLSWTLPRLVGTAKAKELLMLPTTIGARAAQELGLATEVVAASAVASTAFELASRLAEGPTVAYGAIRRSLAFSAGNNLGDSLAFEADMMRLTGSTEDHREAVKEFMAKQQPRFSGR